MADPLPLSQEGLRRLKALAASMERELLQDILPFWLPFIDQEGGGFQGWIGRDRSIRPGAPKGLVMHARFLWAYSAAYARYRRPEYLEAARASRDFLCGPLADPRGGFHWSAGADGAAEAGEKIVYGQAFAIYALAQHYMATGDESSLDLALRTFSLLEGSARDRAAGGYAEATDPEMRKPVVNALSDADIPCVKSMNTNLHVLEALSALLAASGQALVQEALRSLALVFAERVFSSDQHMSMYFDADWKPLTDQHSFGHDIEASWLLAEAAEAAWGAKWPEPIRRRVLGSAQAALEVFLAEGGSMPNEEGGAGERIWWVQAETVVGFVNAYELTGREEFLEAAEREWAFIERHVVDRRDGEWFWAVDAQGRPDLAREKGGPWKSCYHNGRACLEVLARAERAGRMGE